MLNNQSNPSLSCPIHQSPSPPPLSPSGSLPIHHLPSFSAPNQSRSTSRSENPPSQPATTSGLNCQAVALSLLEPVQQQLHAGVPSPPFVPPEQHQQDQPHAAPLLFLSFMFSFTSLLLLSLNSLPDYVPGEPRPCHGRPTKLASPPDRVVLRLLNIGFAPSPARSDEPRRIRPPPVPLLWIWCSTPSSLRLRPFVRSRGHIKFSRRHPMLFIDYPVLSGGAKGGRAGAWPPLTIERAP